MAHHSVRIATPSDVPAVARLMEELFNSSVYSDHASFKKEDVVDTTKSIISGNPRDAIVFILEVSGVAQGVLAASTFTHAFNKDYKMACEIGFWLTKDYRTKSTIRALISGYKAWAKAVGCSSMLMGKLKSPGEPETYKIRKVS